VVKDSGLRPARWKEAERMGWAETADEYDTAQDLANHLIHSLVDDEFDIARCNKLRPEIGVGHAFSFLYRRVLPGSKLPMVPVMVNTYYPPNQPTPKRCYAFGQAVRKAIQSWNSEKRVAVMASGGLSHVVIDEDIDQMVIGALRNKDHQTLWWLPREKLRGGTSEILNWVALAGVVEPMELKYLEYVTTYRSPAATGCGMGFAYWL
jgi:3-O-methylgallate 3,4-dioxygenase